jgi:hypothetical protein
MYTFNCIFLGNITMSLPTSFLISILLSFSKGPDQGWDPVSLLFNGYQDVFLRGINRLERERLTTHIHRVLRL